jgi:hypothetical protein
MRARRGHPDATRQQAPAIASRRPAAKIASLGAHILRAGRTGSLACCRFQRFFVPSAALFSTNERCGCGPARAPSRAAHAGPYSAQASRWKRHREKGPPRPQARKTGQSARDRTIIWGARHAAAAECVAGRENPAGGSMPRRGRADRPGQCSAHAPRPSTTRR